MTTKQKKPRTKKTGNFHCRLSEERETRFLAAIKKAPKGLRIETKTDLFEYMLDTFCDAVGV